MLALTAVFLWGLARYKQASAFWQWASFSIMECLIGLTAAAAILRFGIAAGAWGIVALLVPVIVLIIFEERSKSAKVETRKNQEAPPPAVPPHLTLPAPLKDDDRIVIKVKPQQLWENFSGRSEVQAQKLIEIYIGKWLLVSGKLGNVRRSSYGSAMVSFQDRFLPSRGSVFMRFSEPRLIDALTAMQLGEVITVLGRIDEIDSRAIFLEECELR